MGRASALQAEGREFESPFLHEVLVDQPALANAFAWVRMEVPQNRGLEQLASSLGS